MHHRPHARAARDPGGGFLARAIGLAPVSPKQDRATKGINAPRGATRTLVVASHIKGGDHDLTVVVPSQVMALELDPNANARAADGLHRPGVMVDGVPL